MKTLTIEGFDAALEQAITTRAEQQHQSVSQWIVDTLRRALESDQESGMRTYHDLDHLPCRVIFRIRDGNPRTA